MKKFKDKSTITNSQVPSKYVWKMDVFEDEKDKKKMKRIYKET
jgi:hypothetical protein